MIEDMAKLRIIGPKRFLAQIIEYLHKRKVLHITEEKLEGADIGKPLSEGEALSEALVKARSIASTLNIETKKTVPHVDTKNTIKEVTNYAEKIGAATKTIRETGKDIQKLQRDIDAISTLKNMNIDYQKLTFSSLATFIGYVDEIDESAIKSITTKYKLKKQGNFIALFVQKEHEEPLRKVLANFDFTPYELPTTVSKTKLTELKKTQNNAKKELQSLKHHVAPKISRYIATLEVENSKAEAPLRFKETEEAFVISGFVPKKQARTITAELEDITKEKVSITFSTGEKEETPIKLAHPKPVNNFTWFLDLYSLPRYKEYDPTWFLFLTFPLFFGFMLGDMGYGVTTLLIFWLFKKKLPQFRQFWNILMLASVASIFCGALFAETFGMEFYQPLINRNPAHELNTLMMTAIAIGVVHINIGLFVGFVNEWKHHGFAHAFFAKISWYILQASVVLLALGYMYGTIPVWIGYTVLALSMALLVIGEGAVGIIEIPGIFGNILSYARLMAIGLSSVGIAMVVNDMAGGFFATGGASIIWGVIILVFGHMMNMVIGCLGSFLHSLRLHYVELFGKFYSGGGIPFEPFGK